MTRRGTGEGSIYKRSDGRWVAVVHVGYDSQGRRRRKSIYGTTRSAVAARLAAALRTRQQGLELPPERQTVGPFLMEWLEDVRPSVRPMTYRSYEGIVRVHLVPSLGRHRLVDLTPRQVQAFLAAKTASGLAPRSVERIRAVLRQALNRGLRWGLVARNVATLTDPPRAKEPDRRFLSPSEGRQLLDSMEDDRLACLWTVALAIGLRQGEALGLQWSDIDLDDGSVTVRHALQRVDSQLRLVEPKSASAFRSIPLPSVALAGLRGHRARQMRERLVAGAAWRDSDFVFTTTIGTPLDSRNVTRLFQRRLERAGLPRMRFHDLRHSCASLLLAQGVPARVVMEILGHSQISLTMNTYAHVLPSLQRDAAELMDSVFATR